MHCSCDMVLLVLKRLLVALTAEVSSGLCAAGALQSWQLPGEHGVL